MCVCVLVSHSEDKDYVCYSVTAEAQHDGFVS